MKFRHADILRELERQTAGMFIVQDFVPVTELIDQAYALAASRG